MDRPGPLTERPHNDTWAGFCLWALFGVALALVFAILGTPAVLLVLLGGWLLVSQPALRGSAFGVLSGLGAISLYIAFVQRRGPGTVCWHTATASGCDQYANPWRGSLLGASSYWQASSPTPAEDIRVVAFSRRDRGCGPMSFPSRNRHYGPSGRSSKRMIVDGPSKSVVRSTATRLVPSGVHAIENASVSLRSTIRPLSETSQIP